MLGHCMIESFGMIREAESKTERKNISHFISTRSHCFMSSPFLTRPNKTETSGNFDFGKIGIPYVILPFQNCFHVELIFMIIAYNLGEMYLFHNSCVSNWLMLASWFTFSIFNFMYIQYLHIFTMLCEWIIIANISFTFALKRGL